MTAGASCCLSWACFHCKGPGELSALYVVHCHRLYHRHPFCFLVPNGQDLRPAELPRQNICTWILQMTWAADNNANVFPSVHVLGVVAAIAAMWHSPKLKRVWQIVGTVWFVIIAASTLLVKQHAFIDLAAALVWGAVVYVIVYVIIGHKRDKMGLRCGAEDPGREDGHDHSPDPRI